MFCCPVYWHAQLDVWIWQHEISFYLVSSQAHMWLTSHATCQALPINIDINWLTLSSRGTTHISSFLVESVTGHLYKCSDISPEAVNMRQFNLGSSPLMRSLVEPHVGEYQEPVRQSIVGTMVLLVVRICHNRTGGSFQVIHDQDDNGSTSDTSLPQLSTCDKDPHWSWERNGPSWLAGTGGSDIIE